MSADTDYSLLIREQRKYLERTFCSGMAGKFACIMSSKMRRIKAEFLSLKADDNAQTFEKLYKLTDAVDRNKWVRKWNRMINRLRDIKWRRKNGNSYFQIRRQFLDVDKGYSAVVCIAKNEGRYIREWICFQKTMGFDHVFIFDNDSSDNLREELSGEIDSGFVTIISFHGPLAQLPAYRIASRIMAGRFRWVAFIDADEFAFPTDPNLTMQDYLRSRESADAVGINWVVYGPGIHETRPDGLVTENYIDTFQDRNNVLNLRIKSIVNPDMVFDVTSPHFCVLKNGKYAVDEDGEEIDTRWMYVSGSGQALSGINKIKKVRINHYWTKSKQDLMEKCMRGYAAGGFNPDFDNILKRLDYPMMEDKAIFSRIDQIKQYLNEMTK